MDSALITLLTGTGVCGVFCCLFITGLIFPRSVVVDKDKRIAELEAALAAERTRADISVAAATASRDVMAAFQAGRQLSAPGTGPPP